MYTNYGQVIYPDGLSYYTLIVLGICNTKLSRLSGTPCITHNECTESQLWFINQRESQMQNAEHVNVNEQNLDRISHTAAKVDNRWYTP